MVGHMSWGNYHTLYNYQTALPGPPLTEQTLDDGSLLLPARGSRCGQQ